ncbi:hypothetical protein BDD12DRAFT_801473 [Trichophaea hybrida]|nr:hypothetical protein BDD12DRAFT_801473 [Trichophaea hybrida]
MPSRNNPNLPSSLNRRVLSHRRIAARTKSRVRTATTIKSTRSAPTDQIPKSFAGVVRGKTVSSKKVKKVARNKNYALERKKEQQAEELLKTKGEVEMADITTAPLSKRQQKLAARAAKVAEDNAKAKAAIAAEKVEAVKKAVEEAGMEVDEEVDI